MFFERCHVLRNVAFFVSLIIAQYVKANPLCFAGDKRCQPKEFVDCLCFKSSCPLRQVANAIPHAPSQRGSYCCAAGAMQPVGRWGSGMRGRLWMGWGIYSFPGGMEPRTLANNRWARHFSWQVRKRDKPPPTHIHDSSLFSTGLERNDVLDSLSVNVLTPSVKI